MNLRRLCLSYHENHHAKKREARKSKPLVPLRGAERMQARHGQLTPDARGRAGAQKLIHTTRSNACIDPRFREEHAPAKRWPSTSPRDAQTYILYAGAKRATKRI